MKTPWVQGGSASLVDCARSNQRSHAASRSSRVSVLMLTSSSLSICTGWPPHDLTWQQSIRDFAETRVRVAQRQGKS